MVGSRRGGVVCGLTQVHEYVGHSTAHLLTVPVWGLSAINHIVLIKHDSEY